MWKEMGDIKIKVLKMEINITCKIFKIIIKVSNKILDSAKKMKELYKLKEKRKTAQ